MKEKSVKKNYFYNLIYQLLTLILPLITTPYISRVLGAEKIGIYSYTTSVVTYFILFGSLGVSMYGQREIAYIGEDIGKRKKSFWEIVILRFITLAIATLIYYFTIIRTAGEYKIYYEILLFYLLASAFDISWFLQGLEESCSPTSLAISSYSHSSTSKQSTIFRWKPLQQHRARKMFLLGSNKLLRF